MGERAPRRGNPRADSNPIPGDLTNSDLLHRFGSSGRDSG